MSNNADHWTVPVPDYQSLMLPVLRAAADRAEHTLAGIREHVAAGLNLTEADVAERLASGSQSVFSNRIAWAVQYLKAAGALEAVHRGVYRITERGQCLRERNPAGIDNHILRQFPEFSAFHGSAAQEGAIEPEAVAVAGLDTPEEALDHSFHLQKEALVAELLEAIHNTTPAAFEKLVVQLLMAMGYGGSLEDAGQVVGGPGDGGIDGVIRQDRLGLDAVYVQAKKWNYPVGSEPVMNFSGGLTKQHAHRGVFITSSTFSRPAREYVQSLPQKIVLVDGRQLANLMIDYNVGVAPNRTYTLKRLDLSYFENL